MKKRGCIIILVILLFLPLVSAKVLLEDSAWSGETVSTLYDDVLVRYVGASGKLSTITLTGTGWSETLTLEHPEPEICFKENSTNVTYCYQGTEKVPVLGSNRTRISLKIFDEEKYVEDVGILKIDRYVLEGAFFETPFDTFRVNYYQKQNGREIVTLKGEKQSLTLRDYGCTLKGVIRYCFVDVKEGEPDYVLNVERKEIRIRIEELKPEMKRIIERTSLAMGERSKVKVIFTNPTDERMKIFFNERFPDGLRLFHKNRQVTNGEIEFAETVLDKTTLDYELEIVGNIEHPISTTFAYELGGERREIATPAWGISKKNSADLKALLSQPSFSTFDEASLHVTVSSNEAATSKVVVSIPEGIKITDEGSFELQQQMLVWEGVVTGEETLRFAFVPRELKDLHFGIDLDATIEGISEQAHRDITYASTIEPLDMDFQLDAFLGQNRAIPITASIYNLNDELTFRDIVCIVSGFLTETQEFDALGPFEEGQILDIPNWKFPPGTKEGAQPLTVSCTYTVDGMTTTTTQTKILQLGVGLQAEESLEDAFEAFKKSLEQASPEPTKPEPIGTITVKEEPQKEPLTERLQRAMHTNGYLLSLFSYAWGKN